MTKIDLQELKQQLITTQNELNKALMTIDQALGIKSPDLAAKARASGGYEEQGEERIVEGVFDGQGMKGPEGKEYTVPANYASKSKLVEGDLLKLTIRPDGTFLFKQIGPIERDRLVGVLAFDDQSRQYFGVINGKSYLLLTASVTYYKGEVGDEVIMLVPAEGRSNWAAVENIVKQLPVVDTAQKDRSENESLTVPDTSHDDLEPKPLYDENEDEFRIE